MSERDIINLIFLPGFSTAEPVTNISGRGVGMDVVKSNMERIGGSVDGHAVPGVGTTFRIKIPLTLAIVSVDRRGQCGRSRLAIPQASLLEIVRLEGDERATRIEHISGAPVFRLRDNLLPLVSLREALGQPAAELRRPELVHRGARQPGPAVRSGRRPGRRHRGNRRHGRCRRYLKAISEFSGVTMLADGRLAMIVDVWGLAAANRRLAEQHRHDHARAPTTIDEAQDGRSLLVVRVGEGRRLAIPMEP